MKINSILKKLFFASALTVCSAFLCAAQSDNFIRYLNDGISPKTKVTALDLVRKVFPDAETDKTDQSRAFALNQIPVRDLPGISPVKDFKKERMEGELQIRIDDSLETRYKNEKLLWLLINAVGKKYEKDVYSGNHILAVFRVGRRDAELIDAAIIKKDDYAWFASKNIRISNTAQLTVTPRREAVFIYTRGITNGGSSAFSLIELKGNKLNVVLSEFDLWSDYECDYFIYETARTRLLKSSTAGYRQIEIRVTTEKGIGNTKRPTADWRGRYRYVFAWQPRTQTYKAVINPDKQRFAVLNRYDPCRDGKR